MDRRKRSLSVVSCAAPLKVHTRQYCKTVQSHSLDSEDKPAPANMFDSLTGASSPVTYLLHEFHALLDESVRSELLCSGQLLTDLLG